MGFLRGYCTRFRIRTYLICLGSDPEFVQPPSATEFTLGHNVNSIEEVDAAMAQAESAGAVIVKPAADTFWGGYAGYFQDPDGHLWEVVYNPDLLVAG